MRVGKQPRTQAQITKNRHTTVLLYRSAHCSVPIFSYLRLGTRLVGKGIFVSREWSIFVRVKCFILVSWNVICSTAARQPRTQAQITKNRHTTVLLYRSPPRARATDLYKNTAVCLFLVICAWVRGWPRDVIVDKNAP